MFARGAGSVAHEHDRVRGQGVVGVELCDQRGLAFHLVVEVEPPGLARPVRVLRTDPLAKFAKRVTANE